MKCKFLFLLKKMIINKTECRLSILLSGVFVMSIDTLIQWRCSNLGSMVRDYGVPVFRVNTVIR